MSSDRIASADEKSGSGTVSRRTHPKRLSVTVAPFRLAAKRMPTDIKDIQNLAFFFITFGLIVIELDLAVSVQSPIIHAVSSIASVSQFFRGVKTSSGDEVVRPLFVVFGSVPSRYSKPSGNPSPSASPTCQFEMSPVS